MEKIKVKLNSSDVYSLSYKDNDEYRDFMQSIIYKGCEMIYDFPIVPQIGMRIDYFGFMRTIIDKLKLDDKQRKCLIEEDHDSIFPIITAVYIYPKYIEIELDHDPDNL